MSTPIKRLEIIKNAIELEDDDIIQSQLTRLKNEAFDDELQAIVVALEQKKLHCGHRRDRRVATEPACRDAMARSAGRRE